MALRLGFKINRYLYRHTFLYLDHTKAFSSKNPKLKLQPAKAASTLTQEQLERKLTNQNVEQISSIPETTIIPSELENEPMIIRRKFAKSSTQIALTQPLKLSRLANPFPESVKTIQSEIVSDAEKSRIMQEEVKMEARFHLQMQQEKLEQQKLNKQFENPNQQSNNNVHQSVQPEPSKFQQFHQMQQQSKQPTFRKPKEYTELLEKEQGEINQSEMYAVNTSEANAEEKKERRPRGNRGKRKSHTRAARYLRHSWYPRHVRRQQREYSTAINPVIMSDVEQCEKILRRLKETHPEYRNLQKPLCIPGSKEEKQFIKNMLRLIASQKIDKRIKTSAPFPSYSEVKTYKYDCTVQGSNRTSKDPTNNISLATGNIPRFYSTKKTTGHVNLRISRKPCPKFEVQDNNRTNKDSTNNITLAPGNIPRFYSTKKTRGPVNLRVSGKPCPKFELKGMKPATCNSPKEVIRRKQEAPYPSYSEVCDDPLEDEPAEHTFCPWKADISSLLKTKSHLKHYSTASGDSTNVEMKKQEKEYPPPPQCESPFDPRIPTCDYEEQARIKEEKKRKKHCPKKPKPCNKAKAASNVDSGKIISKIKAWLSSYKPDSENIKITRSTNDIDGRETYIIDVCEYEEITPEQTKNKVDVREDFETEIVEIIQTPPDIHHVRNPFTRVGLKKMPFKNIEYKPSDMFDSHACEMTQPIPVLTKNIPEFFSPSVSNVTPRQKPEELKLIQAKPIKQQNQVKTNSVNKISAETIPTKISLAKTIPAKSVRAEAIAAKRNAAKPVPSLTCPTKAITTKLEPKPSETKINVETKPKEILINKVKENFIVKKPKENAKVNVVKKNLEVKPKNFEFNKVDKSNPVKKEEPKSKFAKENKMKTKDFNLLNMQDNIFNSYKDFKVNEMIENRRISFSDQNLTKDKCYKEPGCNEGIEGGCKKKKEQPNKKCRLPKKRKLPSCDDVKNKKNNKCMPLAIPGLEDKPEYFINAPKKTYFKKSDNISNFINLHTKDIEVLASQKSTEKDDSEPFKLKPQFWKK